MEGLTWAAVASVIALMVAVCSIASFYFGRRKAVTDDAEEQGSLKTDIKYIKDTMETTTKSVDTLSTKLDAQSTQREQEYREMLVQSTELRVKYEMLSNDVIGIKKEIARYHHN